MVSEMFDKAIQFLKDHKEIALATSEGNLPKLHIFQIMKQEGHVLYFLFSALGHSCVLPPSRHRQPA